jgi:predicted nucleotide-binding protein
VLSEFGVPHERATAVLEIIIEGAQAVGFLHDIKGRKYVDLNGASSSVEGAATTLPEDQNKSESEDKLRPAAEPVQRHTPPDDRRAKRVFITHGKSIAFVEPVKKLLAFGELEPVVSVERQSVSQPVPDKVMNDMRGCGAAIIHVEEEMRLLDKDAQEHIVLNPNVLIEIGAAMALYGRRFILLVRDGVKLPSNLQGLYEVRYEGSQLDSAATIKLLEAIRDIKNHQAPAIT